MSADDWDGRPAVVRPAEPWRIDLTRIGDVDVSTVQLANDDDRHGFETLIFGGRYDDEQEHYTTKADAVAGHARWVERVRADEPEPVL